MRVEVGTTTQNSNASTLFRGKTIILFTLVVILFAPVIFKLIRVWIASEDYSHGFFVIPLSFYMFWRKRTTLLSSPLQPLWLGLPVFGAGIVAYFISSVTKFHTLTHLSMLVIIVGLLLFLRGWYSTKELLLPVLFLLFMFPIPSAYYLLITNPMKLFITKISTYLIGLMGIPVYREGNLLYLASMKLEVAEACSGIRSIYSYLMLGCLFAVVSKQLWTKIVLIASTVPLALMINVLRVTITGILAGYMGAKASEGFFHEFSGIALFVVGLMIFFLEYRFLEKRSANNRSKII